VQKSFLLFYKYIQLICFLYHRYTTCGASAFQSVNNDGEKCCPGRTCKAVAAIVNGRVGSKDVCVPTTASKRDNYGLGFPPGMEKEAAMAQNETASQNAQHLERRVVGFCYSKCIATGYTKAVI
jgi:hypothetical protein